MEQIVANSSKPDIICLFSRPEDGRWGPGHSVRFPLFSTRWIWSASSSLLASSPSSTLPSSSLTSSYLSSLCFIIYVFKCTTLCFQCPHDLEDQIYLLRFWNRPPASEGQFRLWKVVNVVFWYWCHWKILLWKRTKRFVIEIETFRLFVNMPGRMSFSMDIITALAMVKSHDESFFVLQLN